MSRQNSGRGFIGLVLAAVFGIFMAIGGSPEYLLYLVGFIFIPILFMLLTKWTSPERGQALHEEREEQNETVLNVKEVSKPAPYKLTGYQLSGILKETEIPKDIQDLTFLININLHTVHPIEISEFINQNRNLKNLTLSGPFWFKRNIKVQVRKLSLYKNENVNVFLENLEKRWNITEIEISSCPIDILKLLEISGKASHITIKNSISNFPYELLNSPFLEYLNLSNNHISRLSRKELVKTNLEGSSLKVLNLAENRLNKIPTELFRINSLAKVYLYSNPIRKRNLKMLIRKHDDKIFLDSGLLVKATRTFHPDTWVAIKILFSVIFVLFPYFVSGSLTGSFLCAIFVFIIWTSN